MVFFAAQIFLLLLKNLFDIYKLISIQTLNAISPDITVFPESVFPESAFRTNNEPISFRKSKIKFSQIPSIPKLVDYNSPVKIMGRKSIFRKNT